MRLVEYLLSRFITFLVVIVVGITIIFFLPRFMPSDPVDMLMGRITAQGAFMDGEMLDALRKSLQASFGLEGNLLQQYGNFLKRVLIEGDFGPSLAMYPTPVSKLIAEAVPWTFGLLLSSMIIAWILGNAIGVICGYWHDKLFSKTLETIALFVYPIPYYILALLLIILFTYVFEIFPFVFSLEGEPGTLKFWGSVLYNSLLPGLSIILVSFGWWVLSMKALSAEIVEEDFVYFAKLRGVRKAKIITQYVMRNAVLPQVTVLALQIGGIFNGALITEILFGYPGLGNLIHKSVLQADYNLMMGTISLSIVAVAAATFMIDIIYPFLDPRIRYK